MALQARLAARNNTVTVTSGLAPGYLQVNLIVLPSKYAQDFRNLCQRNPVPCPLLAETNGSSTTLKSYIPGCKSLAADIDIATDAPQYMIYENGSFTRQVKEISKDWTPDHVGFLIGCSFSFESALAGADLGAKHIRNGLNVPMYRTTLPLHPAGLFQSTHVVSMRPYKAEDVEEVRRITRPFLQAHGEPIAWGWQAVKKLGIKDIYEPEWGDPPWMLDDEVPVFWGCGVTPQEAVLSAKLEGVVMSHAPGNMIVLDVLCGNDGKMTSSSS